MVYVKLTFTSTLKQQDSNECDSEIHIAALKISVCTLYHCVYSIMPDLRTIAATVWDGEWMHAFTKKTKRRELLTCWVNHSLSPQAFFQKLPTGLTSHDLDLCIDATAEGWKQHVPCCFLICNTSLDNMQSTSQSCYNTGALFEENGGIGHG